jgi:hypothetical protein
MRKFFVGAVLTYLGFFLFLVGFMIRATSSPTLDKMIQTVIPLDLTTALKGTIILILSGLVGITGLLLCIAVSKPTPAPITIVQQAPITVRSPVPAQAPAPASPTAQNVACIFCGHYIEPNEIFCPSCNRAQR